MVDTAQFGEGGEQLWVGIIPKALVQQLEKRLPRTPYPLGTMQIPNRWMISVSRILTTLARGAQQMLRAKEAARNGRLQDTNHANYFSKSVSRRRFRNQDIRVLLRKAALRQAKLVSPNTTIDVDHDTCSQLLNDTNTSPINATRRIIRTNIAITLKSRSSAKHRRAVSTEQEYFKRTNTKVIR